MAGEDAAGERDHPLTRLRGPEHLELRTEAEQARRRVVRVGETEPEVDPAFRIVDVECVGGPVGLPTDLLLERLEERWVDPDVDLEPWDLALPRRARFEPVRREVESGRTLEAFVPKRR